MGFKRNVVFFAVFALVAILIFMFVSFTRGGSDVVFPPVVNKCPDFWDYEPYSGKPGSGICKNTFGIKKTDGTVEGTSGIDFEEDHSTKCEKKVWTTSSGYTWDGISNNSSLNCDNDY